MCGGHGISSGIAKATSTKPPIRPAAAQADGRPRAAAPKVRMPALGLVPELGPEMAAMPVVPGDIHTNVLQRFWSLTAVAGNNPLAPNRWPAMIQYAQSTSLIMPSVFPIQKYKDDRS